MIAGVPILSSRAAAAESTEEADASPRRRSSLIASENEEIRRSAENCSIPSSREESREMDTLVRPSGLRPMIFVHYRTR